MLNAKGFPSAEASARQLGSCMPIPLRSEAARCSSETQTLHCRVLHSRRHSAKVRLADVTPRPNECLFSLPLVGPRPGCGAAVPGGIGAAREEEASAASRTYKERERAGGVLMGSRTHFNSSGYEHIAKVQTGGSPLPSGALDFSEEKTPQYLSFRGCIDLHDWKGI